jgi:hypothetical protein
MQNKDDIAKLLKVKLDDIELDQDTDTFTVYMSLTEQQYQGISKHLNMLTKKNCSITQGEHVDLDLYMKGSDDLELNNTNKGDKKKEEEENSPLDNDEFMLELNKQLKDRHAKTMLEEQEIIKNAEDSRIKYSSELDPRIVDTQERRYCQLNIPTTLSADEKAQLSHIPNLIKAASPQQDLDKKNQKNETVAVTCAIAAALATAALLSTGLITGVIALAFLTAIIVMYCLETNKPLGLNENKIESQEPDLEQTKNSMRS